ncbi:MAG: ABC transporter permease [Lachnospiraceae bacterium]|nr:ABC transporter permease [Lachnospiraceae bacterium]
MIMKNSIRQLLRMKGRAVLFLFLLFFASGLFSLGRGFWIINQEKTEAYEGTFKTIGLVEQRATAIEKREEWDPETGEYKIYPAKVFSSYHSPDVLDFEGADYLSGPEKRITYGAYWPDCDVYGRDGNVQDSGLRLGFILEVTPLEDGVLDHTMKVRVEKVWKGSAVREGDIIRVCDHFNPKPDTIYADKRYVMDVYDSYGGHAEGGLEFCPGMAIRSMQTDADGKRIPDEVEAGYFYEEVTEDFWESDKSRRWRNLLEVWDYSNHIFPVTGTCDIGLLMPFYTGEAYLVSGRDFTEEEYAQGEKVCLIPEGFARKNGLKIGDQIRLPLLVADHAYSAGIQYSASGGAGYSFLNAGGEPYEVFEDSQYTVTGIYGGNAGMLEEYGMGYQEVLIPGRSVKNSDADNIVSYGPMKGSTTAFQIENGTIEEYLAKWSQLGIDDVEITFYDRGYTELEANISNMGQIARILITAGMIMVLLVLGYFSWIFILRQRERTAVERSLGFGKRHSFFSLFCGIFLLMLLGSAAGCTAGSCLAGRLSGSLGQTIYYDTSFGNSGRSLTAAAAAEETDADVLDTPLLAACQNALLILVAGSMISGAGIAVNLRQEPMQMFESGKE